MVISKNENQIKEALWTDKELGEKIKLVCSFTDNDEGKFVADAIIEQKLRNHFSNKDCAICIEPMHKAGLLRNRLGD